METKHLQATPILDYSHPSIQAVVARRGWSELPVTERIGAVYDFVKDEIAFGYNISDDVQASKVLADGYGQCNTKTSLLMAMLRAIGVPCRFHGATIDKRLQRGLVDGLLYHFAPDEILHSWAEIEVGARWIELEGVILDAGYLEGLRKKIGARGPFLGYGAGTDDIDNPSVSWCGDDTAIQKTGLTADLGVYDHPDEFYREHGVNLSGFEGLLFRRVVRQAMNRRVSAIRDAGSSRD